MSETDGIECHNERCFFWDETQTFSCSKEEEPNIEACENLQASAEAPHFLPSRSQQRRLAIMKEEPVPTFKGEEKK
jgi:hypothetical protein